MRSCEQVFIIYPKGYGSQEGFCIVTLQGKPVVALGQLVNGSIFRALPRPPGRFLDAQESRR